MAGRRVVVTVGDVFGHIWFEHQKLSLVLFVAVYAPAMWGLWWLHNDHIWLAAMLGAVAFWGTLKVAIALAVVQTINFYQGQQRAAFKLMEDQALAHARVEGKAN
jgi:uncharacterized membrane protein